MTCLALSLYVLSSVFQAIGAYGVIRMRRWPVGATCASSKQTGAERSRLAGPSPLKKLQKYATAENDISDVRRWTAVGLLVGGLPLGAVANVVALYA